MSNNSKIKTISLFAFLGFVMFCIYARFADFKLAEDNLLVLGNNYSKGFVSAGLMGTIWTGLDHLASVDLMGYEPMYYGAKWMMIVLSALTLCVFVYVYSKTRENAKYTMHFIVLGVIIFGGMYVNGSMLGSFDMYMTLLALIAIICIFSGKGLWLIVPLSALGILIHPSFLFKFLPLMLVMLLYDGCKRTITVTVIVDSIIFLISEIASVGCNRRLSSLNPEWGQGGNNYVNLLVLFLFFSPYLLIGRKFFVDLYKSQEITDTSRKLYRVMQLGVLMILPEFILKVEYGNFIAEVIIYYLILMMFFLIRKDERIISCLETTNKDLRDKYPVAGFLLLYPVLFMPFLDTAILNGLSFISHIFGA